jgi:putative phosphoribosyl transferase
MTTVRDVRVGGRQLPGELVLVPGASGVVLFAHGSGSSRHSPRNRHVAWVLQRRGLATLLMDLLDPREAGDRATVFDITLLAHRLGEAIDWVRQDAATAPLVVGLFGASTGAAAALRAAAAHPDEVAAVVSRGGRPDLADDDLPQVRAPTLLILGGEDRALLPLHRAALARLPCAKRLAIVPGATHLFEEPGALDQVATLAGGFFARKLSAVLPQRTMRA